MLHSILTYVTCCSDPNVETNCSMQFVVEKSLALNCRSLKKNYKWTVCSIMHVNLAIYYKYITNDHQMISFAFKVYLDFVNHKAVSNNVPGKHVVQHGEINCCLRHLPHVEVMVRPQGCEPSQFIMKWAPPL